MSIDRCKCPVCAALPSNPTLIAPPPSESVTYRYDGGPGTVVTVTLAASQTIFDLVKADLDERDKLGHERFKQPLTVDTYDQWLAMAYEEALDLAVYLRGALAEREVKK